MMKTEYERCYQWTPPGGDYYSQHCKNKNNPTEPIMTHKRRVKVTEDNVIIGEPLPTQSNDIIKEDPYFILGDKVKKFYPSVPYRNIKAFNKNKEINKSNEKLKKNSEKFQLKKTNEKEYSKKIKFVNESVQTENNENLIPEQITKNQPLEIKKIPESNSLKTEYQIKYAWKDPLIKQTQERDKFAENQSKLDMKLKIYNNFISEYQRQFRPYEFVNENRFKRMKPSTDPVIVNSNLQVIPDQVPRRAVTPPPRFTYKNKSKQQHQQPINETINPQRLSFPHGKQKRFLTEYSANFDNKWKKIELEIEKTQENDEILQSNQQSKWFKEILELRKKAQEYRQKTRGTHFSREHFGEIFTKSEKKEIDNNNNDEDDEDEYYCNSSREEEFNRRSRNRNKSPVDHLRKIDKSNEESSDRMNNDNRRRRGGGGGGGGGREGGGRRRRSSIEGIVLTNSSVCSSGASTIVGKLSRSNSRSPEPRNQNWMERSAGKPSFDNNLLLDEEASHDTEYKDELKYSRELLKLSTETPRQLMSTKPEKKYTFQKYFNENDGNKTKNMRTIDYDAVSKNSSASKMSSLKSVISTGSSRSLALETLERAKRNRDEILRSKS